MSIAIPRTEKLTVDEYMRLAAREGWERVELEDGVVVELSPEHLPHARTVAAVYQRLARAFPYDACFFSGTLPLSGFTAYEPDIFVLDVAPPLEAMLPDAVNVVLVVEVAFSSRGRDLGTKSRFYAAAGIPEYWVVEPERGLLHRHTEPGPDGYAKVVPLEVGRFAETLDVAAILAAGLPNRPAVG